MSLTLLERKLNYTQYNETPDIEWSFELSKEQIKEILLKDENLKAFVEGNSMYHNMSGSIRINSFFNSEKERLEAQQRYNEFIVK